eukprot:scaffold4384_cov367-Prasinococcus_capsulatus_cf.AAC.6
MDRLPSIQAPSRPQRQRQQHGGGAHASGALARSVGRSPYRWRGAGAEHALHQLVQRRRGRKSKVGPDDHENRNAPLRDAAPRGPVVPPTAHGPHRTCCAAPTAPARRPRAARPARWNGGCGGGAQPADGWRQERASVAADARLTPPPAGGVPPRNLPPSAAESSGRRAVGARHVRPGMPYVRAHHQPASQQASRGRDCPSSWHRGGPRRSAGPTAPTPPPLRLLGALSSSIACRLALRSRGRVRAPDGRGPRYTHVLCTGFGCGGGGAWLVGSDCAQPVHVGSRPALARFSFSRLPGSAGFQSRFPKA